MEHHNECRRFAAQWTGRAEQATDEARRAILAEMAHEWHKAAELFQRRYALVNEFIDTVQRAKARLPRGNDS